MEYHADRFEDASVLVYQDGRVLALLPANVAGTTIESHGGLTFGGLISGEEMTIGKTLRALQAVYDHFRSLGNSRLVYKPVPHIYHRVPAEDDLYALFLSGAQLVRRDLSTALSATSPRSLTKGRKSSRKRAANAGIRCEESGRWADFMHIERETLESRHGVQPVHTSDELELLAGRFPHAVRLFCAFDGDEILAGAVVFETEIVAHTQYLGTVAAGREIGALDLLLEHLISDVYATKPFFDFGISTTNAGRHLNAGLARYKESFGARSIAYDRYEMAL